MKLTTTRQVTPRSGLPRTESYAIQSLAERGKRCHRTIECQANSPSKLQTRDQLPFKFWSRCNTLSFPFLYWACLHEGIRKDMGTSYLPYESSLENPPWKIMYQNLQNMSAAWLWFPLRMVFRLDQDWDKTWPNPWDPRLSRCSPARWSRHFELQEPCWHQTPAQKEKHHKDRNTAHSLQTASDISKKHSWQPIFSEKPAQCKDRLVFWAICKIYNHNC